MPRSPLIRPAVALVLSAASVAAFAPVVSTAAVVPPKNYGNNNGNNGNNNRGNTPKKEEAKLDPVVIKFETATKQRMGQTEIMVIVGFDPLTGTRRQFPVNNQPPQDKTKPPKYEPNPRVAGNVNDAKPGSFLKLEVKAGMNNTVYAERAEPFEPAAHEEEPGTFVVYEAFKDTVDGTDVFKVTLTKFGKFFECYAPMVPAEGGKGKVPDPQVVAQAEAVKKKDVVEATIAPQGGMLVVTSVDPYQEQKQGKFTKLADADVAGQKGQAVDVQGSDGQTATLLVPGKLTGKKWVSDAGVLAEARKVKPGTAVLYRTREVEGKTYVRQIVAAPKESGKVAKAGGGSSEAMTKDMTADKKDAKKK